MFNASFFKILPDSVKDNNRVMNRKTQNRQNRRNEQGVNFHAVKFAQKRKNAQWYRNIVNQRQNGDHSILPGSNGLGNLAKSPGKINDYREQHYDNCLHRTRLQFPADRRTNGFKSFFVQFLPVFQGAENLLMSRFVNILKPEHDRVLVRRGNIDGTQIQRLKFLLNLFNRRPRVFITNFNQTSAGKLNAEFQTPDNQKDPACQNQNSGDGIVNFSVADDVHKLLVVSKILFSSEKPFDFSQSRSHENSQQRPAHAYCREHTD